MGLGQIVNLTFGRGAVALRARIGQRLTDSEQLALNSQYEGHGEFVHGLECVGDIEVVLSAMLAGSTDKAYGFDTTDEMVALSHENKENVEPRPARHKGPGRPLRIPMKISLARCVVAKSLGTAFGRCNKYCPDLDLQSSLIIGSSCHSAMFRE
jgi:hypothetical protein